MSKQKTKRNKQTKMEADGEPNSPLWRHPLMVKCLCDNYDNYDKNNNNNDNNIYNDNNNNVRVMENLIRPYGITLLW